MQFGLGYMADTKSYTHVLSSSWYVLHRTTTTTVLAPKKRAASSPPRAGKQYHHSGRLQKPVSSHSHCTQEAHHHGLFSFPHQWKSAAAGIILSLTLCTATPSSSIAAAANVVDTYTCLFNGCRGELSRCIMDPTCASNLICIETCNGRPDDADCQIGCGNLYQNSVVDKFNECVLSRKKCVSQRPDDGSFPAPSLNAVVKRLKLSDFDGKWYISSGLNPTFDTFDCQLHKFSSSAKKLTGNLTWRVKTPDDGFISRSAVQNFVQDPIHPGLLYNHDNELLHYQEDWYILSAKLENKEDDYIFIFYRGKNDAWSAYGGSIVYTRTKSLPPSIVPNLEAAARNAGLDFSRFQATDNSCQPQPPLLARIGNKLKQGEEAILKGIQEKARKGIAGMIMLKR